MNDEDRKRMNKIENLIISHGEDIAVIKNQNITIFSDIKQIKRKLLGNGKDGICDTMTTHKTYFRIIGITLITLTGAIVTVAAALLLNWA